MQGDDACAHERTCACRWMRMGLQSVQIGMRTWGVQTGDVHVCVNGAWYVCRHIRGVVRVGVHAVGEWPGKVRGMSVGAGVSACM